MNALRILILCVSAALVCASIRTQHPQIASAVALAAGVAALMLSTSDLGALADALGSIEQSLGPAAGERFFLLRLCGIGLIAEFASDICADSGESALAKRIDIGTKLAIAASALPFTAQLLDGFSELLS